MYMLTILDLLLDSIMKGHIHVHVDNTRLITGLYNEGPYTCTCTLGLFEKIL